MRIYDLVDDDTKRKLNVIKPVVHRHPKKRRRKSKRKEKLSDADLRYLMGVHRDRYHKVNGKVKRK